MIDKVDTFFFMSIKLILLEIKCFNLGWTFEEKIRWGQVYQNNCKYVGFFPRISNNQSFQVQKKKKNQSFHEHKK